MTILDKYVIKKCFTSFLFFTIVLSLVAWINAAIELIESLARSLIAQWFGLESTAAAVLIVQIATPVAVTSYLLAEKYGADADAVAGLVVASTVMSLITIPLTLAFLV